MVCMALSPMLILEKLEDDLRGEVVGLSALLHRSKSLRYPTTMKEQEDSEDEAHDKKNVPHKKKDPPLFERNDVIHQKKNEQKHKRSEQTHKEKAPKQKNGQNRTKETPKQKEAPTKPKRQHYEPIPEEIKLARGVSGLPFEETPALIGAKRGHIECDENVNDLSYWNSPQGHRDADFKTHFENPPNRYLAFEPDPGGWNNIRISMEVTFVLAAATGRTLVLPPRAPMYLLGDGTENARSFANFFPLNEDLKKKVNVITMQEFLEKEGSRLLGLNASQIETLKPVADICVHQPTEKDKRSCDWLFPVLQKNGIQPEMEASKHCLVFDNDVFDKGGNLTSEKQERVNQFCGVRNLLNAHFMLWIEKCDHQSHANCPSLCLTEQSYRCLVHS